MKKQILILVGGRKSGQTIHVNSFVKKAKNEGRKVLVFEPLPDFIHNLPSVSYPSLPKIPLMSNAKYVRLK